jgi:MFS family permease
VHTRSLRRSTPRDPVTRARNAVATVFVLNGLNFATLWSRVPDMRDRLELSNGQLGLLLLAVSVGSVLGTPLSGRMIERFGAANVVRSGAVLVALGIGLVALGVGGLRDTAVTATGLCFFGFGTASWDVAMNVEGAQVETRLGRTVLPRFHAAWSLGSITGAGLGVLATLVGVPLGIHLVVIAVLALAAELAATKAFLPAVRAGGPRSQKRGRSAWVEPRTLAIGAMVLAFTFAEGSANDWLALSLVDGYDARHFVGVAGFALFVSVMTIARVLGPQLLDRVGRVPVLLTSAAGTATGVLLLILSQQPATAAFGIVLWGLGAALGFPVGVSAAADDPARAALRVSVVSSIGMGAYLAGPPLLGFVGNQVGTLNSLYVVVVMMLPAALLAHHAARPPGQEEATR